MDDPAREIALAARRLVNARLPVGENDDGLFVVLEPETEFWVAARNMRAVLSHHADATGVDGEQDR